MRKQRRAAQELRVNKVTSATTQRSTPTFFFYFFLFFFLFFLLFTGGGETRRERHSENVTVSQRDNDHRERHTSSPTEMICEVHTSLPLCRHVTALQVMGGSTKAHQPSGLGLVTISSSLLVNQPIRDFSYHPIATLSLSLSLLSLHFILARNPCPQVKIKARREVIRRSASEHG